MADLRGFIELEREVRSLEQRIEMLKSSPPVVEVPGLPRPRGYPGLIDSDGLPRLKGDTGEPGFEGMPGLPGPKGAQEIRASKMNKVCKVDKGD
ncbi:collagen-like triple helix repeat-containing protein [Wolbachia pipientis]|uniref:collagen-like triple helix repeat-containing protein n=1 Tax=Wolbachia pipientis TaxID=955 RepID=UPI0025A44377|nr:collagen-like protein [Wolbachia pipientis]MDM8335284.1 collagen-like protein [Wolbachia pipientis]